jgi:hypothetical protein
MPPARGGARAGERVKAAVAWLQGTLGGDVLTGIAIVSVVAFVLGVVVTPLVLIRLPADYFIRRDSSPPRALTAGRVLVMVVRNVLGALLILLGVLLLVLPGQGLITLLVGVFVLDFRGKRKWEQRIVARPGVLRFINRLRQRAGRAALEIRRQE